ALDDPHQRQAQLLRHLLPLEVLAFDGGVRRAAGHGEGGAADHHRPPVEPRPPEHEIGGHELLEVIARIVEGAPSNLPELVKAPKIGQLRNPLPNRIPPPSMLPLHPLGPTKLLSKLL